MKKWCLTQSPRGFSSLVLNELCDRLSFYGLISMLVLFYTQHFHFNLEKTYHLYGAFITLGFLLPTVGGYLTDRYFNYSSAVLLGLILSVIGNLILSYFSAQSILLGFAFLICGIGLLKANNASLFGFL